MKKDLFHWYGWMGVGAFSWFMWGASSFLSYWGFIHLADVVWWMKIIAGGFAIGINFVEFMLDNMTLEELTTITNFGDVVLRLFGVVCYVYDVWTNILGFGLIVLGANAAMGQFSIGVAFQMDPVMAIFAVIFGIGFAIGPEPLYIQYMKNKFPYPGHAYKGLTVTMDDLKTSSAPSPAVMQYLKTKYPNAKR